MTDPQYPQQGPAAQGFPAYPGAPMAQPQQQVVARPREVERSFWLWIGAMVFYLATGIVYSIQAPELQRRMFERMGNAAPPPGSGDLMQRSAQVGSIVGVVFLVIAVGVWLLFAVKMRAGRNWARITMTVFTGLYVLGILLSVVVLVTMPFLPSLPAVYWVLAALTSLFVLAAMVLMYVRPSRPYFAGR